MNASNCPVSTMNDRSAIKFVVFVMFGGTGLKVAKMFLVKGGLQNDLLMNCLFSLEVRM